MFVKIEHINDVLPHISFDDGFAVRERQGFTVVDYAFTNDDTFNNAHQLECRGLKFAPDGRILARPLHKFFNIGEREQPHQMDWSQPHVVVDKLDGSMIHPCMVAGEMVFMTRGGISEQAESALIHAPAEAIALCREVMEMGATPCFEFTGPDNRIIILYPDTRLTLLAVRDMVTGAYWPRERLIAIADKHGVPLPRTYEPVTDVTRFLKQVQTLRNEEGRIIIFDNGHRVKVKAESYRLRHNVLAGLRFEKMLVGWIADRALDDIIALLPEKEVTHVRHYNARLMASVTARVREIEQVVASGPANDRKAMAGHIMKSLDKRLVPAAFKLADGKSVHDALMILLQKAAMTQTRLDRVRDLFDFDWRGEPFETPKQEP